MNPWTWLKEFVGRWANELIAVPVAIVLFLLSPLLLRWIDPTAGVYDVGVFQIILLAVVTLLILSAIVWLMLWMGWRTVFDYFQNDFRHEFSTLQPWDRVRIASAFFLAYLLSLSLVTRVF